jgi:hypothetical protein
VIYLAIFVLSACAGIGALWLYQRRQRMHLDSVDGFRSSLERISTGKIVVPRNRGAASERPGGPRRPEPLDPARREAARRRLERRRATRA